MSELGWMAFYSHLRRDFPRELVAMAQDFAGKPIDLSVLVGDNIAERLNALAGPTRFEDNPETTIRGIWGPYDLPNTIVHSSDPDKFDRDIGIIKEYGVCR